MIPIGCLWDILDELSVYYIDFEYHAKLKSIIVPDNQLEDSFEIYKDWVDLYRREYNFPF